MGEQVGRRAKALVDPQNHPFALFVAAFSATSSLCLSLQPSGSLQTRRSLQTNEKTFNTSEEQQGGGGRHAEKIRTKHEAVCVQRDLSGKTDSRAQ